MKQQASSAGTFRASADGAHGSVLLTAEVEASYRQATAGKDAISLKRKVHLERNFQEFCDHKDFTRRLSDEKFKREGAFSDGLGASVPVWVFKAWQLRIYGAILAVNGKRCFLGVEIDPAKKTNKANQGILKATAKAIGRLPEYKRGRRR